MEAGNQFRLSFRQVKGSAISFRNHRDGEDHECNEAQREKFEDEPDVLCSLRFDDADHAQCAGAGLHAGHHDRADDGQAHGDFVGDHLRARAQRAH